MTKLVYAILLIMTLGWLPSGLAPVFAEDQVPLMTIEELKARLGDDNLKVLDVRRGTDWRASEFKIPGAVYLGDQDVKVWSTQYEKDQTLVLYCA